MQKRVIEMELISDACLSNGSSTPGSVDVDICVDENGFPCFNSSTFKGNLRESLEIIEENYPDDFNGYTNALLGKGGSVVTSEGKLKLSNFQLPLAVREHFKDSVEATFTALTHQRAETSINENGVAADGTFRLLRVLKRGYKLYAEVADLDEAYLPFLCLGLSFTKHVGYKRNRGLGRVAFRLYEGETNKYTDITAKYAGSFLSR